MTEAPVSITSRDNPLLARVRRLARGTAYRKERAVWLEGEHLCAAACQRGRPVAQALVAQSAWEQPRLRELARWAPRVAVTSDALFGTASGVESPGAGIGYVLDLPPTPPLDPQAASVVLDRLQDAGNVGSVLRSAAALGFGQVIALEGTAGLWSPKVLRAAMGAHFALGLIEAADVALLERLRVPLIAADVHASALLHETALPYPCGWVLGHEGQGVDPTLLSRCALRVRIEQPGGEESLNVAAAAAICLHAARHASRA
jgi:TrmH family RNA methyltransferase